MGPMNFCSQCGHKLVASWNVCPNCGNILNPERLPQKQPIQAPPPQQTYSIPKYKPTPQPIGYYPRNNNTNGIIALIFGLLGLLGAGLMFGSITFGVIFGFPGIFGQFAIVASIIGIVFGAIGRKKDDDRRMATAGFILGIIGIVIWIAFFGFLFLSIFRSFYYYIPD
ncbi:MAG: zinc-ribbon domain-containing protein [Candidatus Hermodarchaeota archaeon]